MGGWEYSCSNRSLLLRYENYCIIMQRHEYSWPWVVKVRNTSEAVLRLQYTPDSGPMDLGQYD